MHSRQPSMSYVNAHVAQLCDMHSKHYLTVQEIEEEWIRNVLGSYSYLATVAAAKVSHIWQGISEIIVLPSIKNFWIPLRMKILCRVITGNGMWMYGFDVEQNCNLNNKLQKILQGQKEARQVKSNITANLWLFVTTVLLCIIKCYLRGKLWITGVI